MEKKEQYLNLINHVKNNDYLSFKQDVDNIMIERLDNYYKNRTKEIYNTKNTDE